MKKTDGFNREGEGRHDPREDVDYYSKLNIIVSILRLNVFPYLQKGSKYIFIFRFLWEYQVYPTTTHTKSAITIFINNGKTRFTFFLVFMIAQYYSNCKVPIFRMII